jgi:hypothetical protein
MKPILLGIDGLSYSSFVKCQPKVLLELLNVVYRGVVFNKKPQFPASSWLSVLEEEDLQFNGFLNSINEEPKLVKTTHSIPINIPIINPTYGKVSLKYDYEFPIEKEIELIYDSIFRYIDKNPIIVSITGLDRLLHNKSTNKCNIYKIIDDFIKKILNKIDDFIIFSIYGEPLSNNEGIHEDYGIYLATIPRPVERDTIKLYQIGQLFRRLVVGI